MIVVKSTHSHVTFFFRQVMVMRIHVLQSY